MEANETPSYSHENNLFEIVIWLKKEYLIDLEYQHTSLKVRVITIHAWSNFKYYLFIKYKRW